MAEAGTLTFSNSTVAWSVGMLSVHSYEATVKPGLSRGTIKAVMPRASPSLPDVRAKTKQCVALCMPVCHFLLPLIW